MSKPKFKVGDVLMPVVEPTDLIKLHVLEVKTQICVAAVTQIFYRCRVFTKHHKLAPPSISIGLFEFNEMEVKLWKEKKE